MTTDTTTDADLIDRARAALAKLREPFAANQISLLPKQVRKGDQDRYNCVEGHADARKASKDGKFCGGWHAWSVHLDYVGHAALTDRLLDADPFWTWEPVATDDRGLPLFDQQGGIWIKLTVAGVTRLGYGDAQGKTGPNATKEAIGDALRNAGMRFGAALDLWHKGDLHDAAEQQGASDTQGGATGAPAGQQRPNQQQPIQTAQQPTERDWRKEADAATTVDQLTAVFEACKKVGQLGRTTTVDGADMPVGKYMRDRKAQLAVQETGADPATGEVPA